MDRVLVSVVILTKNEEKNIVACIDSVRGWADEVVVVDDLSTDQTVAVAQKLADKVLIKKMDIEGTHRNWAYAQVKNDWVFSLDADERATPELGEEIRRALATPSDVVAYSIPRRNYIGTTWVKSSGWYPSAQIKLFRKDKFKFEEVEVHPRAFINGPRVRLTQDIIHYSYKNYEDFLNKLNKQTTLEAKKWIRTGRQMSLGRASWRTIDRLFRKFIGKKGWKDGFTGFMVAFFDSLYQVMSYAKYREMLADKPRNTDQEI
jgi:glycosyltransferase involved in cell wall biosynthesis